VRACPERIQLWHPVKSPLLACQEVSNYWDEVRKFIGGWNYGTMQGYHKGQVTILPRSEKPWISVGDDILFEVVEAGEAASACSSVRTPIGPIWSTSGPHAPTLQGEVRTEVGQVFGDGWQTEAVSRLWLDANVILRF